MAAEMNSPFRYPGGKFYARDLIIPHIPPHTHYCEPFAGGASIFFAKPKATENWLNDLDVDLVNMYLAIRDTPEELIASLDGEVATKERHRWYKLEFQPTNDLERAQRWYYLNRTSYSGIMRKDNLFWGYGDKYSMRPENWPRNIRRTSEKLQDVRITNWDCNRVVDEVPDGAFLFIDPPYYGADQDKFYNHTFSHGGHALLAGKLREHRSRIKFLVTYDNCEEVRALYDWATELHDREWNYVIARTDDQKKEAKDKPKEKGSRGKGRELFVVNYNSSALEREHVGMHQMAMAF